MKLVSKLKKERTTMTNDKTKKSSKRIQAVKSLAWLTEASFRTFAGWILISNFDHWATTAAAIYAFATAGVVVVFHFFKANK
jgi:hypothetical protein